MTGAACSKGASEQRVLARFALVGVTPQSIVAADAFDAIGVATRN